MARPRRLDEPPGNHLLSALPSREYRQILPLLKPASLLPEQVLSQPGQPFTHAYFPTKGIVSVVVVAPEGGSVEVGIVGKEGMVGITMLLDGGRAPTRAVVQSPGEALTLPADFFRHRIDRKSTFYSLLLRYADAYLTMVMHMAACNHFHSLEHRLASWLLMTHDRLESDEFTLTQRLLGRMLGVRRMSITSAARKIQQAGWIQYRRGRIVILDRANLEAAACSCYGTVRDRFLVPHLLNP